MTGSVLTLGETMLLLTGGGVGAVPDLEHLRIDSGGAESNVAAGLVRAGVPTTWIGRIGTDPAGERVLRDLAAAGVDTVAVRDPERSTGLMMKERLADGRTRVTYHRRGSAGSALAADDVPAGAVERAALVHCSGITLALSDSARDAVHAVLDRAEAAAVPVSFDVNHRPKLLAADRAGTATAPWPSARRSCSPGTTRPAWCSAATTIPRATRPPRTGWPTTSPRSRTAARW